MHSTTHMYAMRTYFFLSVLGAPVVHKGERLALLYHNSVFQLTLKVMVFNEEFSRSIYSSGSL